MLPKINPVSTKAWRQLQEHHHQLKQVHLRELFRQDGQRYNKYSIQHGDILFDYSKKYYQLPNT